MSKLQQAQKRFEKFLIKHDTKLISSFHPHFERAFWEMVLNGGKRFRPNLLFSIVLAKKPKKLRDSFPIALAIESLHTYSLIHDDLPAMDNAALRRNHQTLHIKYDETTAILAGDALNTYAFYLISISNFSPKIKAKLVKSLSFGAMKMVLGQACDCHFENQKLKKEKLDFIHINKTANLIASSLEMGGIIAKLSKDELQAIRSFGLRLGLFFQIRDDILDVTSNSEGKSANNDINKNSYVNLLGLKEAESALKALRDELRDELKGLDSSIERNLTHLLTQYLFKG